MPNQSKQQWLSLWQRIKAKGNPDEAYEDLVARYSAPHRAYHTLEHIGQCLGELEQVRRLAKDPDTVEFALWYHDAVYDTKAKDNEERSAELALAAAKSASLPDGFGRSVSSLILATKHTKASDDSDAQLLMDIDLSILGQPEEKFDEYERQIRKEYGWITEETFISGRGAILRSFLDRSTIYSAQFFRDKYEAQARRNIIRSLARLSNRS